MFSTWNGIFGMLLVEECNTCYAIHRGQKAMWSQCKCSTEWAFVLDQQRVIDNLKKHFLKVTPTLVHNSHVYWINLVRQRLSVQGGGFWGTCYVLITLSQSQAEAQGVCVCVCVCVWPTEQNSLVIWRKDEGLPFNC